MKTQGSVLCSLENGLCRLTLNRPEKLNALSVSTFEEIAAHLDRLETQDVGCLLLSGAGRSFCAGHDLEGLASGMESGKAERYSGTEAAHMGLADFAVPEDELDAQAEVLCADILATSRRSNRAIKKLLTDTDGMSLAAGNA
jgi:enoyl-CoA hydratase/carnithine racemase